MKWIKIFFLATKHDLKSIPLRAKIFWLRRRAKYLGFRHRKLYVEKSIPFILLLLPSLFIRYCFDAIRAHRRDMSIKQFRIERLQQDEREAEALRTRTNKIRVETMDKFTDLFPGATINDWDEILKDRRPVSVRFLMALFRSRR